MGVRRTHIEARPPFDEMHPAGALDELLTRADVLSLHVRASQETRGLIGSERLALLPEGALVLNSARGSLLDENALLRALDGNVAAAWLDVFSAEPLSAASPLWSHARVLVTPHSADQVEDFPRRFAEHFVMLWQRSISGPSL